MKNACEFVGKTLGYCAVIYVLCLIRSPAMRPDLRPAVRAIGAYLSDLYPDDKVDTAATNKRAEHLQGLIDIQRIIHELPQTPRN